MGKTNNLISHIENLLQTITGLSCHEEQAKKPTYPYLVYSLDGFKYNYILEINLWDRGNALTIEDKADLLEKELDGYTHLDENMRIVIYMETRNNVSDPNDNLRRRRLTFSLHHYERSNE